MLLLTDCDEFAFVYLEAAKPAALGKTIIQRLYVAHDDDDDDEVYSIASLGR